MFPKLVSQTYTISDLEQKLQFLKLYLKLQFFGGENKNNNKFRSEDLIWLESMPADFLKGITVENLEKTFEQLETQVKTLKSLAILVPTELPPKTIAEITNKLRKDYGPNFFIEIKIDPNLIAGCALVWNGSLRDYSLKAKIDEMRPEILAIFKSWR